MNPFVFGVIASGTRYCPRPDLETTLQERLLSGQNVYLLGPRRVGKTSLVERVASQHFKKRHIRIDFMTVKTSEEAIEWVLNAWLQYERSNKTISSALKFIASLNLDVSFLGNRIKVESGDRLKRLSLDDVFNRIDKKPKRSQPPLLLFFDEFQTLLDIDKKHRFDFLGKLRKGIQHLAHVRVVYAGSVRHALHEIFQNADSPFYNAAEPIEIEAFEPRERFHKFLGSKFLEGERAPANGFWSKTDSITLGNPSDTQRLCGAVWETSKPGEHLTEKNIEKALSRIFEHEQRMNGSIIEHSTAIQKKCLVGIAIHGGASPTSGAFLEAIRHKNGAGVTKALSHYVKSGVLLKNGPAYHFTNPFFREWLIRTTP
jgi:hypothetical protein